MKNKKHVVSFPYSMNTPIDRLIQSIDLIISIKEKGEIIKQKDDCQMITYRPDILHSYFLLFSNKTAPELYFCDINLASLSEMLDLAWKLFLKKQPKSQSIELTELEIQFIRIAINLKEAMLPFNELKDSTFEEDYGFTKKQMLIAIDNLSNKINSIL